MTLRNIIVALTIAAMLAMAAQAFAAPDDEYTVSLMHFNGDLTDASGKVWTTLTGSPVASTTQSKFGGGALYLDGSSAITTANSSDFDFGAGEWTIEWWQYSAGSNHLMLSRDNDDAPFTLTADYGSPGMFTVSEEGGLVLANVGSNLSGQWSHIAIVRTNATGRVNTYQDGSLVYSKRIYFGIYPGNGGLMIGKDISGSFFTGYIDELRISKGICRFPSAFDVPTAEYQDQPDPVVITAGPPIFFRGGSLMVRPAGKVYFKEQQQ